MNQKFGGCLGKLVALAIILPIGIIAVLYFTSQKSPFGGVFETQKTTSSPNPITVGKIVARFDIISAEQRGEADIEGTSKNILPFSTEKWYYKVVMTMTASIDMRKLRDSDIQFDDSTGTLTLRLPAVEIKRGADEGWISGHSKEFFSADSSEGKIIDQMRNDGRQRIENDIKAKGELAIEARFNAERDLRDFILRTSNGAVKQVRFLGADEAFPTSSPSPSSSSPNKALITPTPTPKS